MHYKSLHQLNKNAVTQKGFTLLETLLYIGILAILLTGMTVALTSLLKSRGGGIAHTELAETSQFVINRIENIIRGSYSIQSPAVGEPADSTLVVVRLTPSMAYYTFNLEDGVITLKVNTDDPVPITSSLINVTSLSFENFSFSSRSKNTVRLYMELESADPAQKASTSIETFLSIQ